MKEYYNPPKETPYLTADYIDKVGVQTHLYGIYMRDVRIGYMKRLMLPTSDGYKLFEEGNMKISFLGEKKEIVMNMYSDMDKSFRLKTFVAQINSDKENIQVKGEMEGSSIAITLNTREQKNVYRMPMKERPVIPSAIVPYMMKSGFTKDATTNIAIFDPSTVTGYSADVMQLGWETITIEGEKIRAFHIKTLFKGIEIHGWVDETGTIVKELSPVGLVIQKEREKDEKEPDTYFDANLLASVETVGRMDNARNVSFMKIRVDAKKELVDILQKYNTVSGNIIAVQKGDLSSLHLNPESFLAPSPFINSDDIVIRGFVPGLIKNHIDDTEKVRAMMVWVYKNVKKRPTFSLPFAKDVFVKKIGDCNEHAVLFAALARAARIPCAIASGMVYTNGNFYYHAWNLVYIDGRWVSVDSTFGQFPADATHIILAIGDISDGIEIMQFLKNIKIEIVEARQ